jgi:hypothetical protein
MKHDGTHWADFGHRERAVQIGVINPRLRYYAYELTAADQIRGEMERTRKMGKISLLDDEINILRDLHRMDNQMEIISTNAPPDNLTASQYLAGWARAFERIAARAKELHGRWKVDGDKNIFYTNAARKQDDAAIAERLEKWPRKVL